jgi:hypothetical protein
MRHQESGIDVDIVFGSLPFEKKAVAEATWMDLGGVQAPLPLPEDLIIMKEEERVKCARPMGPC